MMTLSPFAVVLILITVSVPIGVSSMSLDFPKDLELTLFSNQWGDIRLETSNTNAHNHNSNRKASDRTTWMNNNSRDSGDDEDNVTYDRDSDGDLDCFETAPVLICHICTREWHDVGPKCVAMERNQSKH
jgi:hypothetical protein